MWPWARHMHIYVAATTLLGCSKKNPQQKFLATVLHILFRTSLILLQPDYFNRMFDHSILPLYVHVQLNPLPVLADKKSFEEQTILPIGNVSVVI